jgi:hypothetical protein
VPLAVEAFGPYDDEKDADVRTMSVDASFQVEYTATSAFHDILSSKARQMQIGSAIVVYLEQALAGILRNCKELGGQGGRPDRPPGNNMTEQPGGRPEIPPGINGTENPGQRPDRPPGNNETDQPGGRPDTPPGQTTDPGQSNVDANTTAEAAPPTRRGLTGIQSRMLRVAINSRQQIDLNVTTCPVERKRVLQGDSTGTRSVDLCYNLQFGFELQLIGDEDAEAIYEQIMSAMVDPGLLEESLSGGTGDLEYMVSSLSANDYSVSASSGPKYNICVAVSSTGNRWD